MRLTANCVAQLPAQGAEGLWTNLPDESQNHDKGKYYINWIIEKSMNCRLNRKFIKLKNMSSLFKKKKKKKKRKKAQNSYNLKVFFSNILSRGNLRPNKRKLQKIITSEIRCFHSCHQSWIWLLGASTMILGSSRWVVCGKVERSADAGYGIC